MKYSRHLIVVATLAICIDSAVAESIYFSVNETAGLRRFGYPVTASLDIEQGVLSDATQARLLDAKGGEPPAQFTAMSTWPDGSVRQLDVDFTVSLGPNEAVAYTVEFGKTSKAPGGGLEVTEAADELVVKSSSLAHRIRRDGKPLLSSIAFGELEFLAPAGVTTTLPPGDVKIVKRGPINVTLQCGAVTLEYVSSKSWVKIVQRSDDDKELAVDANFHLPESPVLWDFGVGGWLYGTLSEPGHVVEVRNTASQWQVITGPIAKPTDYAVGESFEGWGHLWDAKRVIAFGMTPAAGGDRPTVSADGVGRFKAQARGRELTVYFHVVGPPVQVTAVTSPQSMLAPLAVTVEKPEISAAPAREEELAAKVMIRRDTFGVPHILAETEEAAAFGHGYASAEDHILTLAPLFMQARSESAEHFGADHAEADLLAKQLRIHAVAESGYAQSPPWVQAIFDGYAGGYNRYLRKNREQLPDWIRPISGIDVLAHCRRVIVQVFSLDLQQLEKIGSTGRRFDKLGSPIRKASNMWAVGKGRSASGKGILLANPQLPWEGFFLFYEAHIRVPGKIDVSGVGLLGMPCIVLGFNEHLGWSHTVNDHDCDDVYELTLDPENEAYLYDGRWRPLQEEEIVVQVKTPTGLVPREQTVYRSHHGPVLKQIGRKAYAFKSANLEEHRFVEQWNLMAKSRSLDEFRSVLDLQALPMFNICYADKEGSVFYVCNGRFPDRPVGDGPVGDDGPSGDVGPDGYARPVGYDWLGVVPGDTSATEWNRLLPQSRLPHLVNPRGGYVQNCNSAPWYTSLRAPIDRRSFPYWFSRDINGFRQQVSLLMIDADESISLEEVKRYKHDPKWVGAERFKADLVKIATAAALKSADDESAGLKEAADVLSAWDNRGARDSKGALLFATIMRKYWEHGGPVAVDWNADRPVSTPAGIGSAELGRKCVVDAIRQMNERHGSLAVAWGDVHRLRRGTVDVPIAGVGEDVMGAFRGIDYSQEKDGKFAAVGGDSYVLAVEFTSPPTAYSISAYSQSSDPASPHYADQSALFADEKWKPAWFTEEDIARNVERSYHP